MPKSKKRGKKKRSQVKRGVRRVKSKRVVARKAPAQKAPVENVKERTEAVPRTASIKKQILFCPGPVNLSSQVRSALAGPEVCHREPEFMELMQTIRLKLLHALGLNGRYSTVLINGSGTAALEAAMLRSLEGKKRLLIINNGVYGSRIAQIARIHELPYTEIRSPLTEQPDLDRVAAALKRDGKIGTVAMVHHETSTGLLNPVESVGALTKKFRRRFLVDAISSLGAEKWDLSKSHVGICVGSTGKCLHGVPGGSFVLLSQEEAVRISKGKQESLYLDLGMHLKTQEAGELPFTPSVPIWIAFHAALDELIKEGVKKRIVRYQERAALLRGGFKKLKLDFLLPEKLLSNSLTALWVPKEISYSLLHKKLKRAGFVIYAGQNELQEKIFRIAHMGQLLQGDLKEFLKTFGQLLRQTAS